MDWSSFLDLLGALALVATFASMLRYRFAEDVRLWLAGYSFIVLHFAIQFVTGSSNDPIPSTFAVAPLIFAALFFVWAATSRRPEWSGFRIVVIFGTAQLPYDMLSSYDVHSPAPYLATLAVNLGMLAYFARHRWRDDPSRRVMLAAAFGLTLSILVVMRFDSDAGDTLCNVLCFDYLVAGAFYARRFRRASAGVTVTVLGFIAWASVFPVGALLDVFLPHVRIDGTAWNIPKYVVGIGIVVTLLEEQIRLVHHLALHDALTGLPNRRFLDSKLADLIALGERARTKVGVIAIDLDGFKEINDSLGHDLGDDALRAVASRLLVSLPSDVTCARIGGDEFIIAIPDLKGREELHGLSARVLSTFGETFRIGGQSVKLGASVGTAMWPEDANDSAGLLVLSDRWMYAMKRENRFSEIRTGT